MISDEEYITLLNLYKSPTLMAKELNIDLRSIYRRRNVLEQKYNFRFEFSEMKRIQTAEKPKRLDLGIRNGSVIIFSDAHFWPGIRTTAYNGLLWAIRNVNDLKAVINNGDAFDGAGISRYPRIGWDKTPSLIEELKACELALGEIEDEAKSVNPKIKLMWPLGNHDARFENRLAANAPQYEHVKGFSLKDHFEAWQPCWSVWLNEKVIVKHRWKGGVHATHNNTVNSGVSMVTGHLHSLKVTPFDDYHGTRFGIDTGTLAEPSGPQFENYLEHSPTNWRSGFVVLTFVDGVLLWPEVIRVLDTDKIDFRGQVIEV
jgi:nitrite reductase/ring-hydroxylating ferredoxin subunit